MNSKTSSQAGTSPQTRELLRKLSAGLSREELEEVLSGALSALDEAALRGLQKRLDPDTAAALERSLKASDADSVKAGRAKIMQEWKLLWSEWNEILSKACDEDGPYVIHEHHWEEPYYDPTALADDLDGVAARMAPLAGRVFEENLAPDFSFAGTVKEIMDDVSGGLPDWMEAFVDGLDLGPRTTACLIDWEWRAAKREGKNAFEFLDRLRELEYDSAGLSLDGEALRGFARKLGEADQRLVLEGLRQSREVDRWKEALGASRLSWFNLRQDLSRGLDRPAYLAGCREKIAQDWTLAVPVAKDLSKRKAHAEMLSVCGEAARSFFHLREGGAWNPAQELMAARGFVGREAEKPFLEILDFWAQSAKALGREEEAEALRLQARLHACGSDWDQALKAFRQIPERFSAMSGLLFGQWRDAAAERSMQRGNSGWGRRDKTAERCWVHVLAEKAYASRGDSGAGAEFRRWALEWLGDIVKKPEKAGADLNALTRLCLDIGGGAWLSRQSASLARLSREGWNDDRALENSRRRWLERLGASELEPALLFFWKRNVQRFVPDPGHVGGDYKKCAMWLAALRELSGQAPEALLRKWAAEHWRRRNLWSELAARGFPPLREIRDVAR